MPNTLCHIGLQLPISRRAAPAVHPMLPVIGCILPDLPWISYKLLLPLNLFDPYQLRLYCMAQASLIFSLLLSFALACLLPQLKSAFALLAGNSLAHLLLDTLQVKWGNGVHLFIPLSWQMTQLQIFWPEHWLTLLLTLAGGFYLLAHRRALTAPLPMTASRLPIVGFLLAAYFLAPLLCIGPMYAANNYHTKTLSEWQARSGKEISFDRAHYFADRQQLRSFAGEYLQVEGSLPSRSGRVSFQGRFETPTRVQSSRHHYHLDQRDLASIIGLLLACTFLSQSLLLALLRRRQSTKETP